MSNYKNTSSLVNGFGDFGANSTWQTQNDALSPLKRHASINMSNSQVSQQYIYNYFTNH